MQTPRPSPFAVQMSPVPRPPPPTPATATAPPHPHPDKPWRIPKLLFQVKDVSHPGAVAYFRTTNTQTLLSDAVVGVLEKLYTPATAPTTQRSITLILRSMDGVAYTTGSDLDDDHKEIHFNLDYIAGIPSERVGAEILGVVRHEMVHCWQYNGRNTCPGGLIEGIADWVRLKDGFCPPHWSRGGRGWDDGYQNTAYFLDWLEERYGEGTVSGINAGLKKEKYSEELWGGCCKGAKVGELWEEYRKEYGIGEPKAVETCA